MSALQIPLFELGGGVVGRPGSKCIYPFADRNVGVTDSAF
jgi:hypothetical protein